MENSCLKMTKIIRFRRAEFTASTIRFRTMCTATLGDGNDVNMGAMVTHALIWMVGLKLCACAEFSRLGDRGSLFTKEKLLDSQCFG